jgi:hypothetical protein
MKALPDKLSELLELAMRDLEAVEADPRYRVDMSHWHEPRRDSEFCLVCLAGAVMAKTLRLRPTTRVQGLHARFGYNIGLKLRALDRLRRGEVVVALKTLALVSEDEVEEVGAALDLLPPHYSDDPAGFRTAMADLVAELRGRGL